MNVVILGRPGAGKGTQGKRIANLFGLQHLSTGDTLRSARRQGSSLGRQIAELIDGGNFVSDELALKLVEQELLASNSSGMIFDGIPRTVRQCGMLDELLEAHGKRIDLVVELDVSEEIARRRLLKRANLEGRADDNAQAIGHRFEVYDTETLPLVELYGSRGLLSSIDGSVLPDNVFASVKAVFEGMCPR